MQRNYLRRGIGASVCLAPGILLLSSLVCAATSDASTHLRAVGVITIGLLIGGFNAYLSFVRPRRFHRKHRSTDGYRHVSGAPLVGTIFVVVGAVAGFGDWVTACLGLFAFAIDAGGTLWFLIATWRDASLWDA